MQVGVGLPNIIPGTPGRAIIEWGREAERVGFSSIATIGRLTFPTVEELVALAAVAAVTERIGLVTNTLIAPARDPAELAKQSASVDVLSGGRLTLGLAVGWREDDFTVTGRPFEERGRRFDEDLEVIHRAWAGETVRGSWHPVSPRPTNGKVPIVIGGTVPAAFERAAKWGIGWTAGGVPPDAASGYFEQARAAWRAAGRDDEPRLIALTYYGWGDRARERARDYLVPYYGDYGEQMAASIAVGPDEVRTTVEAFRQIGTDELILDPTTADREQLEALARAVLD